MEFTDFGKIPRLNREWVVSEKIDGTNAAVIIEEGPDGYVVGAQSRNRLITPDDDNFGFAQWVEDNATLLADTLGEGVHFGEWAGPGIQKNPHELDERKFFLFIPARYMGIISDEAWRAGVVVVPTFGLAVNLGTLYKGVEDVLEMLRDTGSFAHYVSHPDSDFVGEPYGRGKAEGVVVYSTAARQAFKVTTKDDDIPKALAERS